MDKPLNQSRVMPGIFGLTTDFGGRESLASPCDACQRRSSFGSAAKSSLSIHSVSTGKISRAITYQMHQGDLLVVDAGHEVHGKLLADLQRNSRIWTGIEKDQSPGEELLS